MASPVYEICLCYRLTNKIEQTEMGKKTSPPNQHLRLVASLSTYLCQQSLAHRNPGYMNPLHHGPHDGQTACFRRKRVDLISSLPHEARKSWRVALVVRM